MRRIKRPPRTVLLPAIGIIITAWCAALICVVFEGRSHGSAVPVAFLVIVTLVAIRFGALAGMVGALLSAVIFACFLYQPLGSVSVQDPNARMNLGWLVLGGLASSYLLAPPGPQSHR